ncbi:MAG: GWxTD domain-containing protein [Candidatus Zixiibacteriota bacterium]|jgi:GWxTD domain-containing protein
MKQYFNIFATGALVLLFALAAPVHAQIAGDVAQSAEPAPPAFQVDYASFKGDSAGHVRLEVYYKVYNYGLRFEKRDDNYVAEYELRIAVEDDERNPVDVYTADKNIVVSSEAKAKSKLDFRTSQTSFMLPTGEYQLFFTLRDALSTDVFRYENRLDLKDFEADYPTFSDVEFARHIEEGNPDDSSVFDKGRLIVIPSVSREYEGEENSRLLYYLELYQGADSSEKVLVETIIRSPTRGMIYRDTLTTVFENSTERQLREISSADFPPGDYEMEILLRGRRNKKLGQQRELFSVKWSQGALLRHDYKTALDQIALIARAGEIDEMKDLKTYEERARAFNEFWLARDPSVGTPENEVKDEFYRRIEYANVQFRAMRREGWRTDRGRIYVIHGEPDQIDDYPMSPQYVPYQIWHYYKQGRYRRFLFVDEDLDGDYRLEYPYDGLNQRPDF